MSEAEINEIQFYLKRPKIGQSMHREWVVKSPQIPIMNISDHALCRALRLTAKYIERRAVAQALDATEGKLDKTSYIKDPIFKT